MKMKSFLTICTAILFASLMHGNMLNPGLCNAAVSDDYFFLIPSDLLKYPDNADCMNEQNSYFNYFLHGVLANRYLGEEGEIGSLDCFPGAGALRLVRNAVYARHGRAFSSEDLKQFYYSTHKAVFTINPKYKDSLLTEVDKMNIEFVQGLEEMMSGDTEQGGEYLFQVPWELLKNKNNDLCVQEQNNYFNYFMYQVLGNRFIGEEGDIGGPDCFLSKGALRLVRNAVYARHGRSFKSQDLMEFYYSVHGQVFVVNPKYNDKMLTDTDKQNAAFISELEKY